MEPVDVVDAQDKIIGQSDRDTAHQQGLLHRIVVVYVFDEDGRLWVQARAGENEYDHTVGGHVGAGEAYDTAAAREAREEVNLVQPVTLLGMYRSDERFWQNSQTQHMQALYECHPHGSWHFRPNAEVAGLEPMYLAEVVDQMNREPEKFMPGFIRSMQQYIVIHELPLDLKIPAKQSLKG